MESFVYQRRIVLGDAVSAAFLAAGILTAGTGLATTLTGTPAAVVPALSQSSAVRTVEQGGVAPPAQAIAPVAAMVPAGGGRGAVRRGRAARRVRPDPADRPLAIRPGAATPVAVPGNRAFLRGDV